MQPRILLFMDMEDSRAVKTLDPAGEVCTFVPYNNGYRPEDIVSYFNEHGREFDAVMLHGHNLYGYIRQMVLRAYSGPKILAHDNMRYSNPDRDYLFEFGQEETLPSDFERLIQMHFSGRH